MAVLRHLPVLAGTLLAVTLLLPAADARGDRSRVHDLEVEVDGNLARISLRVEGVFTPELVERLESGLPTSVVYQLKLFRDHKTWFDNALATSRLHVAAMYDAGTRGYLINYKLDGELVDSRMVRELDEVEQAMTRIDDLPAFHLDPYPRSWRLLVRARVLFGSRTVLFFFPSRARTDWRESRKFRSLNELPDSG